MIDCIPLEELVVFIENTLFLICHFDTEIIDEIWDSIDNLTNVIKLIDFYMEDMYISMLVELEKADTSRTTELINNKINDLIYHITITLSRITWSDSFVLKWRKRINLIPFPQAAIFDEHICWSKMVQ